MSEAAGAGLNLRAIEARLVRSVERACWWELIDEHHYLGYEHIVGESLCYVATHGRDWVALLGWGSAALKCGVRDRWIGWERNV